MPGFVDGVVTVYAPVNVPVCAPADGQPKPPPELTTDGTVVAFRLATVFVVDVPFVTPMPPVPDVPLPIVCSPENVSVQEFAGVLVVIVQPLVIVNVADACGAVGPLYLTFRWIGLAPELPQLALTVTVVTKPNAVQWGPNARLTLADSVVPVPVGIVPEIVESEHEIVPPPDTTSWLFAEVSANAAPAGEIVVAEADATPAQATTSAITTARPHFLRRSMKIPPNDDERLVND
jgi:hypothetical protein